MRKSKVTISYLYVLFIMLMGLTYKYIEHYEYWNIFLAVALLATISLSKSKRNRRKQLIPQVLIIVLFLLVLFLVYVNGDNTYIIENMSRMIPPLILEISLSLNESIRRSVFRILLDKKTELILNGFYILNLVIITIQVFAIHGFLMKPRWLELNTFYPDQCCGVFGNSGTHELCFFTAFITIYNITRYLTSRKKRLQLYIVITTLFSLYISTHNDNMAMFIVLILLLLIYTFMVIQWKTRYFSTRLLKILKIVFSCLTLLIILWIIPSTRDYILKVFERIQHFIDAINMTTTGGYERVAILEYTLRSDWAWRLGKGLGYVEIIESGEKVFGFTHFGLNSTSTFITMGGVWFYMLYCVLFSFESTYIYDREATVSGSVLVIFILFLFYTFYSPVFSSNVSMIWIILTWYCFFVTKNFYKEKKIKNE